MKSDDTTSSVASAIGVAPMTPSKPAAPGQRWTQANNVNTLPDDVAADQCNILQGRACCGEQPPNACREGNS